MARRHRATKRVRMPDWKYSSDLVSCFINSVMLEGKKSIAQSIVYEAMDVLKNKTKSQDALESFKKAIDNVKPALEVRSRRVGGATYQVPQDVSATRRTTLAIRWIVGYARAKKGSPMAKSLAIELIDAYNYMGAAVKKKEDMHKMAEANKAFAHYKW